jgi:SAM-dependent methyltransferase
MVENLKAALNLARLSGPPRETDHSNERVGEMCADRTDQPETPSSRLRFQLDGPIIDIGCSAGRSSFELAERTTSLVLGVDLHFSMLRVAVELLRKGTATYPRRRTGLVYERRSFPALFRAKENVDFWVCDATALPFSAATFGLATGMNVLDCVHAPRDLLASISDVLREGGKAVLTCPYDWSPAATPLEGWLGGHSQRSPLSGSGEAVLRSLLTPGEHPGSLNTLRLSAEQENLEWRVRLHDRSAMTYKVHLVVAEKVA